MNAHAWTRRSALLAGLGLMTALSLSSPARAGEVNDLHGPAIKGYDPVAYQRDNKPVPGSDAFTAIHKGATFRFASAANRDTFVADPARWAPQYGGFCSYAAARGYKADVDPNAYAVIGGKLYLNYSLRVQRTWNKDRAGYIAKADANWPMVAVQTDVVR